MIWKYVFIGLILGIMLGIIIIVFNNRKLRQQKRLQKNLERSKTELNTYIEELNNHCSHSITLLENMIADYRKICKDISNSYNKLLINQDVKEKILYHRLTESELDNDQVPTEIKLRKNP